MLELLHNDTFIFWAAITLICVVPSIAHYWWKARRHELEAGLKRDMIERGMSSEEIVQVLQASKANAMEAKCREN